MKGPFQEFDIKVELDQIRRAADRVETCADNVRDAMAVKTYHNTEITREAVERNVSDISRGVCELSDHSAQLHARVHEMDRKQNLVVQQLTDALTSKNELFQMLEGVFMSEFLEGQVVAWTVTYPRGFR